MRRRAGVLLGLAVLALATGTAVSAPGVLTYQGALTDAAGKPASGTFSMVFGMYKAASGGAPVWSETIANVQVNAGVFTVVLGSTRPLPATLAKCNYLQVSVGGTPLMPRQPLTSVPYALESADADLLGGLNSAYYRNASNLATGTLRLARLPTIPGAKLQSGAVTAAKLAAGAVTGTAIADGAVGTADIAPDAVNGAKVADGSLSGADLADGSVTVAKLNTAGFDADLLDGKHAADLADAAHAHDLGSLSGTVGTTQIADVAVTRAKIAAGAVGSTELGSSSVSSAKIADESIASADIGPNAVGSSEIIDGSVGYNELGSGAVGGDKIQLGSAVSGAKAGMQVFGAVNTSASAGSYGLYGGTNATGGMSSAGVIGEARTTSGTQDRVGVLGLANSASGSAVCAWNYNSSGFGLYVGSGISYFKGYAWFYGGHGDLAENYRGRDVEAGDVVVIGPGGELVKCTKQCDTTVAGIISTEPSMRLSGRLEDGDGVVPLALVGRVLCKVDATGSPIKTGDLLTTSARAGHAMKAPSARRAAGAIIGKALEDLESGTGVIQVLATLR